MNAVPAGGSSSSWGFLGGNWGKPEGASQRWRVAMGVGAGVGVAGVGLALTRPELAPRRKLIAEEFWGIASLWEGNVSRFASVSMASPVEEVVEPTTGMPFPGALEEGRVFTGTGLRKKSILGLKKINVYAYGVYVDPASLKSHLGDKYSDTDPEELKKDEEFYDDVMENDVGLTVRLVIVYGSLKIGSVRGAFEESVGSRIKKFGGAENNDLLKSFTGAFTDDIKLPKGTTIDLTRLPGNVLQTKINGIHVGSVESALLSRSLFDLYIGEDPFDKDAKKSIGQSMASLLCEQ
ncbi:hypothetical protein KC19_3G071600 [Ceratodon purpureus]|uniref:Chalcone isomerase domain-containing protein n=1 Tax=Ceratodon purpureus TaxID=3225 RepID=A0A8T0IJ62_CERPU|nr:hypothetical protein KC19_3G071600 [Ceratodon purpureus]